MSELMLIQSHIYFLSCQVPEDHVTNYNSHTSAVIATGCKKSHIHVSAPNRLR